MALFTRRLHTFRLRHQAIWVLPAVSVSQYIAWLQVRDHDVAELRSALPRGVDSIHGKIVNAVSDIHVAERERT